MKRAAPEKIISAPAYDPEQSRLSRWKQNQWHVDLPVAPEPLKVWTRDSYPTVGEYHTAIQECMTRKYGFHKDMEQPTYIMYIETNSSGIRADPKWTDYTLSLKVGYWLGCKRKKLHYQCISELAWLALLSLFYTWIVLMRCIFTKTSNRFACTGRNHMCARMSLRSVLVLYTRRSSHCATWSPSRWALTWLRIGPKKE